MIVAACNGKMYKIAQSGQKKNILGNWEQTNISSIRQIDKIIEKLNDLLANGCTQYQKL